MIDPTIMMIGAEICSSLS